MADHATVKDENREFILANLHDIMPGLIKVRMQGGVIYSAVQTVSGVAISAVLNHTTFEDALFVSIVYYLLLLTRQTYVSSIK